MIILNTLATGFICLLCFICGYKCSNNKNFVEDKTIQKVIHPIDMYKEHKEEQTQKIKDKKRKERDDIIMDNLNNYPFNQQKVPQLYEDDEENDEEEDEF